MFFHKSWFGIFEKEHHVRLLVIEEYAIKAFLHQYHAYRPTN